MTGQEKYDGLTDAERAIVERLNSAGGRMVRGRELASAAKLAGTRQLRKLVWNLRSRHGVPVLGFPGRGYCLAEDPETVRDCCRQMQTMGRDFFAIASIVQGVTADVVAGQMILDLFPGHPSKDGRPQGRRDSAHEKAWELFLAAGKQRKKRLSFVNVLRHLLSHMADNPDLYREDLAELGRDYGTLLLTGEKARKLREAAKTISEAVGAGVQ